MRNTHLRGRQAEACSKRVPVMRQRGQNRAELTHRQVVSAKTERQAVCSLRPLLGHHDYKSAVTGRHEAFSVTTFLPAMHVSAEKRREHISSSLPHAGMPESSTGDDVLFLLKDRGRLHAAQRGQRHAPACAVERSMRAHLSLSH